MMMQQIVGGEFQDENLVSSIGIFQMIAQSQDFGFLYFLSFMALISINLAVFNSLPIPLVDGGRVAFLLVEAIRKKPLPEKIEKRINVTSFALLGTLVIWVTIRDIINLF
jgi:regulator of sigma E protease